MSDLEKLIHQAVIKIFLYNHMKISFSIYSSAFLGNHFLIYM